ncbi:flavodoxin domain-containing protein [Lachnoclostridium phytofermentans]|uniref:Flavodoxin-like domain-containing protein n=1 Tax=Lachnoclostridium phytofermentans (strain ATCC 700394 / DSM 18823 / ISDg) TaxID=357809 RepID=A9KM36_LACP7|nr:flavodoxin domain-containing protein [Lachnoclostridium phytofermentans]ABX41379.1 conserved hypothetical protein [Lachnoclostridium phytofermentans ISDg]
MKLLVIYKSKTGFTEKYAKWISDELDCPAVSYEDLKTVNISEYDIIIFGSRIHAGRVDGLSKFKKQLEENDNKKLVVFATGATPAAAKDEIENIWKTTFPTEEQLKTPHFYMQAGLSYEKMGVGDCFIMKALAKFLSEKNSKNSVENGCEQAIRNSYDISSKEYIDPLISYIREK